MKNKYFRRKFCVLNLMLQSSILAKVFYENYLDESNE